MDRDQAVKRSTNPRATANIVSFLSFFYTTKLFIKGYFCGLESDDIYEVLPNCRAQKLGDGLEEHWEKEKSGRKKASICRILWKTFGKGFIGFGLVQFATTMIMTIWSPLALSKLISYFSPSQTDLTKQDAYFYASMVIGLNLLNLFVKQNLLLTLAHIGIRAKAGISSILYRKSLRLSSESLSEVTPGKIVTIITKDLECLEGFAIGGNNIWIAMVQTCVICYLIYRRIGIASIPGIVFFFIVLPIQGFIGKMAYNLRLKCSRRTDERLEFVREILSAIKIIKMYTWERFFEKKINTTRKKELSKLHKYYYTEVWINLIGSTCSKTAFFIFLTTYAWMGYNITAETVFYILSCFNDLEESLSRSIPAGISQVAVIYAAIKRVESVLEAPEASPPRKVQTELEEPKIIVNNVNIKIHGKTFLNNISLVINDLFTAVVGHVGTGKTTFLKTILQECHITGDVEVSGKISYASQEPWLFPSTIKNNILFGENYHEKRYKEVLRICCLDYDLNLLPEGDSTVVGDRGINLSKGQQARVNLARAVYRNSDIYLLDDCLASLDAHVSDQIFKNCICNFLKNNMVIYVTNNSDYIQRADRVIVIGNGSVKFGEKTEAERNITDNDRDSEETDTKDEKVKEKKRIYHEGKRSGRVPLKCYHRYLVHGGGVIAFSLIIALFVASQSAGSISDKLLTNWITLAQNVTDHNEINDTDTLQYEDLLEKRTEELKLYSTTITASIVLILIRSFAFYYFMRVAGISIHKAMVRNIINSTMNFFDCHFIGNVLTRFTKDCLTIDETLAFVSLDCISMIFTAAGGVILLTSVNYIFLLESAVLLVLACVLKEFCQPTGRNLERLHVIARGPINGHVNSTLEGLATIRACNAQEIVSQEFTRHQDLFTSAYSMVVTTFRALGFFMKMMCTSFVALIILQFLIFDFGSSVGDVGLVITQSFVITNIISSGIISVADCENLMISVERILEFTELEEEDKSGQILIGWPKLGSINFKNVSLCYDSAKEMLSDINFTVNPKEKIAIVGRTGAGKSSIIATLFRMYDITGEITIDGLNIQEVSLNWLRSNISVIPQDPYLFTGTIRENLDPLRQHQDDEIWAILDELHLKALISDLEMKVDKGSTFSAGQKQLLCLARVILRKNKIVVLDEATANVDQETDTLINEAVRKYFSACTVIIITHRLLSVANCHKVVVLNNGRISESGDPVKLMQNENSFFRSVIK